MTEHFEKKAPGEEVIETQTSHEAPVAEEARVVVDTGRRIDVSKVMLKRNRVQEPEAPKPKAHRNGKPKAQKREIEVVRRPQLEHSAAEPMPAAQVVRPEPTEWDESGDFASMLEASAPITKMEINVGDRVRSRLIHVAGDTAFFSFSSRYEGSMPLNELRRESGEYICQVGDEIDAYVVALTNGILLSLKMGKNMADVGALEEAKNAGIPVEGKITGVNTGGYDVAIANARGFCPLGQIDIAFIEDPQSMLGRTLLFLVTKVGEGGRNIVLNRRKLLERERKQRLDERLKSLRVGDRVEGRVVRLAEFGAFVDLDGVEGLIPNSELGYSRVQSAADRVSVGDVVQVEVLKIEPDPNPKREGQMRIGLSLKAAMPDPFSLYSDKLVAGQTLEGRVARLETFGAFIALFDGIDGLVHISELSEQRVRHPSEVLKIGDPVTVRVLDVDFEKRRISLSLRENVQRERGAKASDQPRLNRGAMVEGVVERIERYGVFLRLSNGQSALLPSSETGTPRGAELGKYFQLGDTMPVMVIEIDEKGRVRVSKMAREQADERAVYERFNQKQSGGTGRGFGTLGDLLKKKMGQ